MPIFVILKVFLELLTNFKQTNKQGEIFVKITRVRVFGY